MKNILIPTDFSANSWNALEYAVYFFRNETCNFYILHIGELKDSDVNSNSFSFTFEKINPPIKEKLNLIFKQIEELPINDKHHFVALQEYGGFIDIMRKTVAAKKVDLIVMGTKGASGIKATIIGSNTGNVITQVLCNVLVIPEKSPITVPNEIGFPTDYNLFYTYPILNTLTELLRISGANLQILNIVQDKTDLTGQQQLNKAYLQDYLDETFSDTHYFHSKTNKNIKNTIQNFIADNQIGMLMMVAKNLNFLQQLLLDNTIEKLSFHTTVPLLVLHEKAS